MSDNEKRVADYYGLDAQINQSMEEMAELIQALNKFRRSNGTKPLILNDVIEEIADVEIMLDQLKYLLHISQKRVDGVKDYKVNRAILRIDSELALRL